VVVAERWLAMPYAATVHAEPAGGFVVTAGGYTAEFSSGFRNKPLSTSSVHIAELISASLLN
jgi:hypothetical protein